LAGPLGLGSGTVLARRETGPATYLCHLRLFPLRSDGSRAYFYSAKLAKSNRCV
jgi:hypothetical protein